MRVRRARNGKRNIQSVQYWLLEHLKGKSYRTIAGEIGKGSRGVCRETNTLLGRLKTNYEVTRELRPSRYFGNHIVDAKFIPAKAYVVEKSSFVPRSRRRQKIKRGTVHISGCDYETHDLPVSLMSRTEELYAYDIYFKQLKELNYPLHSLTCDDKPSIRIACLKHFPHAKIQLCIRHYLEEVARKLKIRSIERTIQSIEKKLEKLGDDFFILTRPTAIKKAASFANRIVELENRYWIAQEFSSILSSLLRSKTREEHDRYTKELQEFFAIIFPLEQGTLRKRITRIYRKFQEDKQFLFTSLRYPELRIPRTTNLQEGYHSHWESRLSSIRGFESEETARNYLNALVLKRRFSILTSCRKRFKHLNGKSPLEHSGGLTATLKDWVQWCTRSN